MDPQNTIFPSFWAAASSWACLSAVGEGEDEGLMVVVAGLVVVVVEDDVVAVEAFVVEVVGAGVGLDLAQASTRDPTRNNKPTTARSRVFPIL